MHVAYSIFEDISGQNNISGQILIFLDKIIFQNKIICMYVAYSVSMDISGQDNIIGQNSFQEKTNFPDKILFRTNNNFRTK